MNQEINKDIDKNKDIDINKNKDEDKDIDINKNKNINKDKDKDKNKDEDKEYYERIKKNNIYLIKQLNIFFGSGRPIYNISLDTFHIKKHNNPSEYIL